MAKRGDWKGWAMEHGISEQEWNRELAKQKEFQMRAKIDKDDRDFNPERETAYNLYYYPRYFGQGKESINQRIERRREGQIGEEDFSYKNDYYFWKTAALARKYKDVEVEEGLTFGDIRQMFREGKIDKDTFRDYVDMLKTTRAYIEGSVGSKSKRKKYKRGGYSF